MTTIPDSVKATLDAQWAVPTGGVEPTYYVGEDHTYTNPPPFGQDHIWILSKELLTDITPVNDTYSTLTHKLTMIVNTPTSGDRLKELSDEVARILNTVAITGAHYQRITKRDIAPPEYLRSHQELMIVEVKTFLADSGIAYGAYTATTFGTDVLTVNTSFTLGRTITAILDEDDMASDDDGALATQQSIKAYADAVGTAAAADVDADIVTHAAITDAHHAKYTDAEAVTAMGVKGDGNPLNHDIYETSDVEAVITAELVNGQSIDNAIDSLITTHAADDDAHHVKYTDAEATTQADAKITAECAAGQTIDNAIDALIAAHAGDDDAHHAVVESHDDLDDTTLTGAYLEDLLSFGSTNSAWYALMPLRSTATIAFRDAGYGATNVVTTGGSLYLVWWCGLPTNKGGLKLYVNTTRVVIIDADANDYVSRVITRGVDGAAVTSIDDDGTNRQAAGDWDYDLADHDCSGYDRVYVLVEGDCSGTAADLDYYVMLEYYYAT